MRGGRIDRRDNQKMLVFSDFIHNFAHMKNMYPKEIK